MNFREALKQGAGELRAAKVSSPVLAAELLLMHATGVKRAWLYAHIDEPVEEAAAERYNELIGKRAAGAPTQHLTGHQEFWGMEFVVTPDVLIPRPETEHVVEVALARIGLENSQEPLRIADVGTGSGCLAVALAREFPLANVIATDISLAALDVARRNALRLGVGGRIAFVAADLLTAFRPDSFDLIVCNPPYVSTGELASLPREIREHEPERSLLAGEEGIEFYPLLFAQAAGCLSSGGALVVELGYGQGKLVGPLMNAADWRDMFVTTDLAGIDRVLAAERI